MPRDIDRKNQYDRNYKDRHRGRIHKLQNKRYHETHVSILIEFGGECIFCHEKLGKVQLILHEIHGKRHSSNSSYYVKHKEDFVLVCRYCHGGIHFLINKLGMTPEEALTFIKERLSAIEA